MSETDLSALEDSALGVTIGAFDQGVNAIDGAFGSGYAEENPALLAGFIQAHAVAYLAERLSGLDQLADAITRASAGQARPTAAHEPDWDALIASAPAAEVPGHD